MFQAAYLGDSLAIYKLAVMIQEVEACNIQNITPLILYEHAADGGNVKAMMAAAYSYKEGGPDVSSDNGKALDYYRRVVNSADATDEQKTEARKKIAEIENQR